MVDIKFTDFSEVPLDRTCPVCGHADGTPLLTVTGAKYFDAGLHMKKCGSCGSGYFIDKEPVIGYEDENFSQDYWLNYAQNGAGISAMLEPLLAIDRPRQGDILDVGCGFGYVPHFWKTCGFGDAIGLETSMYGRVGSEKLGTKIIHKFYADAEELHGRKFDYVFSSEVIEHVEDPEAFVNEISAALSDDGILVLTTPSASALTEDTPFIEVLATLSPGFHYFIASANGLKDVLHKCGFAHVEVHDAGHRLFAWASHKPLPKIQQGFADWPFYLDYLEKLSHVDDPHVAGGALYRAMKDSVNLGFTDRVKALYPRFRDLARAQYDLDLENIASAEARIRARTEVDYEHFPSWLGCGMLFSGLAQKQLKMPAETFAPLIEMSIQTMQKEVELAEQFAGEPAHFIERAKAEFKPIHAASAGKGQPDPNYAYVQRHPGPLKGESVCFFAIYSPDGKISDATVNYINLLSAQGMKVIACIAVEDATATLDITGLSNTAGIVVRENGGMDFSAWARAVNLLPDCWDAQRVTFTNDSIFVIPDMFPKFMERLQGCTADYVALTDSYQIQYHTQSYFFMLQGAALSNPGIRSFWSDLKMMTLKQDVIEEYEVEYLDLMKQLGLTTQILFPLAELFPDEDPNAYGDINVSHHYWERLISYGMPFVKVELLRDNPMKVSQLHWKEVLKSYGVDIDTLKAHLKQRSKGKSDFVLSRERPEWKSILSDINAVRRNARRRRKARRQETKS